MKWKGPIPTNTDNCVPIFIRYNLDSDPLTLKKKRRNIFNIATSRNRECTHWNRSEISPAVTLPNRIRNLKVYYGNQAKIGRKLTKGINYSQCLI